MGTGECPEPTPGGTTVPNKGYFTISPPSSPHVSTVYWGPQSCCCGDTAGGSLLDVLLAYILVKKGANPQIHKAKKTSSPNGSCQAVEIQWEFGSGGPSPQSNLDIPDILLYYLALMAAL